ncbi:unnamed protein product, partial [Durusdinium trenchii]
WSDRVSCEGGMDWASLGAYSFIRKLANLIHLINKSDSAIWFNLTAQALGVRALKIVYKIHEGEHPQPICHPAAGGALCFTSFLMVDAWRSYVGKLASWPRRASSSARACFAFLFDEDAREECLLFCQSLSQQG